MRVFFAKNLTSSAYWSSSDRNQNKLNNKAEALITWHLAILTNTWVFIDRMTSLSQNQDLTPKDQRLLRGGIVDHQCLICLFIDLCH
jgi:hypothetical protein